MLKKKTLQPNNTFWRSATKHFPTPSTTTTKISRKVIVNTVQKYILWVCGYLFKTSNIKKSYFRFFIDRRVTKKKVTP